MYKFILLSRLALVLLMAETVILSPRHCFEYCRYLFFTQRQLVLDPQCDCSSIAEFMFLGLPVADTEPLLKFQESDVDIQPTATYPVKVSYLDNKLYTTNQVLRTPHKQETPNKKDTKNTTLNCKPNLMRRSKTEKCKKQSVSRTRKVGGDEQKKYTRVYEKNPLKKVILENRKQSGNDFLVPKPIEPDTVPINSKIGSFHNIASINSNVPVNFNESVLRDRNDFHNNEQSLIQAQNNWETSTPIIEIGFEGNKFDSNITSDKQQSNYSKEQTSLTTSENNTIYPTFDYKKPKVSSHVVKTRNGDYDLTTIKHVTPESVNNDKDSISTTPSNNKIESMTPINRKHYNETEVPLQKVITREFTNGTVVSSIDGTEDLVSKELITSPIDLPFISTNNTQDYRKYTENNKTLATVTEATNKNDSEVTFIQKRPIIIASLYFLFGQEYIPEVFWQKSNDKIHL